MLDPICRHERYDVLPRAKDGTKPYPLQSHSTAPSVVFPLSLPSPLPFLPSLPPPSSFRVTPEEHRCGQYHLISEMPDNPSVTEQDLQEVNKMWDTIYQKFTDKQERLDAAYKVLSLVCMLLAWERGYLTLCPVGMCRCNDNCVLRQQYTLHTPTQ